MEPITYEIVESIDLDELTEYYIRQGHRAPSSREKLERMVAGSFCVVAARRAGRLIGIARAVTDGVHGYLTECKLDPRFQGPGAVTRTDGRIEHDESGIAKEMACRVIDALRSAGVERIHVLGYGTEVDFCEELGFKKVGGMVALCLDLSADAPVASVAGVR